MKKIDFNESTSENKSINNNMETTTILTLFNSFKYSIPTQQVPYRKINILIDGDGKKQATFDLNNIDDKTNNPYCVERNNWSLDAIEKEEKENGWMYKKCQKEGNSYSLYVKHIPKLYVVDFDTKDLDGCELKEFLDKKKTVYTETKKGYHYYIFINDMIEYSNQQKIYKNDNFEIDLIKKNNIWETADRTVYGTISNVNTFDWNDINHFFDVDKMNSIKKTIKIKKDKVDKKITDFKDESPKKSPAVSPPSSDEEIIIENKMTDKDFEKVKMALLKLNKNRATDYNSWLNVGMALFNNGDNMDNKTMRLWEEFSKQCPDKYDEMTCVNKWFTFKPLCNGLTIASIFHWLKEDNPEEHNVIMGVVDKKDPLRFKKMFFKNLKWIAEDKEWKGNVNDDGVTELMNEEVMRTKKNEYIQIVDEETHYLMNKKDIIDEYAMYSFPHPQRMGSVNPFNVFLNNINRRNIIGLKFDPTMKEDKNYFNIYKGFQYKVTDDNDYSKIEDYLFHIKDVWANGNDETYNYILNWFAHIYQKPEKKTLVAIVIPSKTQGNGKNLALKSHSEIMKDLYYSTAQIDEIVGNFNPSAEGRLLINLNECTWAGRKSQSGILKALVTEDKMTINNKNVKPYMIENYSNVIVTSNDENPIEIEQKDRRYFVLDIKEEKLSDERTKAILNTDNQVLFNYFMKRDISNFDSTKFTRTGKEREMKEFSFDTDFIYWKYCLENNYIENYEVGYSFDEISKNMENKILKKDIINSYNKMNYGYKQKMSDNLFWKNTRKIFPNIKLINANKSFKPRCQFYDIEEMKNDFNKYFDGEYFGVSG
jgi:hypothetical protein